MKTKPAVRKRSGMKRWRTLLFCALLVSALTVPQGVRAAGFFGANNNHFTNFGAPAADALPQLKAIIQGVSGVEETASENKLEIHQDEETAIIEWDSFDIGEDAWTHFDQQGNSDWVALNRIFDKSPSQIYGRLTADGKIYLINQNGILFGSSARVNVHSLVATSLNIDDDLIGGGTLRFEAEDYRDPLDLDPEDEIFTWVENVDGDMVPLPGPVVNWAVSSSDSDIGIHVDDAGTVLLIAPEVVNRGLIIAPSGQIALAAGREVEVMALEDRTLPHVFVGESVALKDPGNTGVAVNSSAGLLVADAGVAGMYGRIVRQEGLIRSVTAVEAGGTIELLASEGVLLGSLSLTATPITDDTETYHQSYEGAKGSIIIGGLGTTTESNDGSIVFKATATERILHQGEILAPCGAVDMSATGWIYLDTESRIDVSGEWVQVSADASIIGLQLNSMELKNDYGQQDSVLQGQEVQIIGYAGSTIGDASEALTSEYLSALEMNAAGGDITIHGDDDTSLQEFIMREGAVIDIAGGGTIYTEGHYDGTKLLAGNQVYDISLAPEWYEYEKILGSQETEHERFGLTEYFEGLYLGGASPVSDFLSSYVAGEDAGSLTVEARGVVLNGTLIASAQAGLYQTELAVTEEQIGEFYLELTQGTQLSRGGQLVLGVEDDPADDDPYDLVLDEVVITAESALLDEDFEPGDELRGSSAGETSQTSYYADKNGDPLYRTVLSTDTLNNSGLSDIRIYSNTSVTIEEDALLTLSPGGYLIDESVDYQTTMAVQYDTLYGEDPATLTIWARAFENLGTVAIPSGNISVALKDTVLANGEADTVIELPSRAYFDDGSTMSTDGERINNLYAGELGSVETGFIDGGEISISNDTQHGAEIIIRSGAVLDVSAGYELDSEGTLTAGTAGALSLESSSILLDGDLRGYALSGYDGGSLTLHATRITVSTETPGSLSKDFDNDSEIPEERKEHLVLGQDQLADTGFSSITLKSFEDLTFEDGVVFTPSDVRLALPGPEATLLSSFGLSNYSGGSEETEAALLSQGLVRVSSEVMGATLIAAMAGEGVTRSHKDDDEDFIKSGQYPRVIVPGGVRLETAPQGEIVLSSVGLLFLEGMLEAPAGSMELTSRLDDIHLAGISSILAKGVNIPEETALISGLPVGYTALDGGTVTLSATAGAVTMDPGAIIDVSGSEPVETLVLGAGNTLETDTIASDSGALEIAFRTDLILNGTIEGEAALSESLGASLVLSRHGEGNTLLLDQDLFDLFIGSGFDSYTFQSEEGILFSEALDLDLGRYLELDAPLITGLASLGDQAIRLSATDVVLCNTREKYIDESSNASESNLVTDETELIAGDATLALSGDWIDIEGAVAIQGFGDVSLEAVWDIRVLDEEYLNTDTSTEYRWAGELRTRGDLTLKASRIYPAMKEVTSSDGDRVLTPTAFVIRSDTGTVTILPGEEALEDPILSAGGVLAVVAPEIEHYGYLAAPLGQIVLVAAPLVEDGGDLIPARDVAITAEDGLYNVDIKVLVDSLGGAYGSVVLGSESVTTTHSDTEVSYGLLTGTSWKLPNKSRGLVIRSLDPNDWPDVSASPETGVIVRASGIDFQEGALIDASGGGGLYAYEFQAGIEGLSNPLEVEGRYVIVPGTSYSGEAVYLAGGGSLPKGVYTLLPAEYAFLPGAYVIEDLGTTSSLEKVVRTEEGYTAVLGYETETGTGARSSQYHRYAVRSAQDVLQEGTFQIAESITGSAGTVSLVAETLTLSGTIELTSLPLFQGGVIELSASRISIGTSTDGFDASLQLDHSLFENMDLEEIRIGVLSTTERDLVDELETEEIHVYEGQTSAPTVTLTASQDVILNDGAEIHAVDESVTVTELTYQYTYDPEVGLGIMSPSEIHRIGDGEDVAGTMMRRTAEGGVALQFYTEDGSFKWVAEQDDPDLEGLGLSAMSLTEEELTALLDLIPEEFNLGYALPYGKAELYSRDGDIVLHEGSLIHATDEVVLDGQVDLRGGRIESDNGALTLAGKNIYFVTDIDSITRENGVYLDTELFDALNSFRHLTLRSGRYADTDGDGEPDSLVEGGDLVFEGGFDLRPAHDLTLQAARIAGLSTGGAGEETTIYGETLHIVGTSSNWVYEAGRVSPDLDGAYTLE
ncbi:MAG: filamentous hemagglutinin N-terminal domain-containing protein, partial [Desulfobacteraceae bacterium]